MKDSRPVNEPTVRDLQPSECLWQRARPRSIGWTGRSTPRALTELIDGEELSENDKEAVLHKNAMHFYGGGTR